MTKERRGYKMRIHTEDPHKDPALLIDYVSDAIISTDTNNHIHSWNHGAEKLYGWSSEEAIGKNGAELLRTKFPKGLNRELLLEEMNKNGKWHGELIQSTKDNRELTVESTTIALTDSSGKPLGTVSVVHDITDRKKAEEMLRLSEERFRIAQELSTDGFLIFRPLRDSAGVVTDFLWIYENDAAVRMYDTNPKEVCGRKVSEVLPNHDKSSFGKAYKEVADTGEVRIIEEADYFQDTFRMRRWFRVVAVPTADGDVAILVQNLTDRKKAEEELKQKEHSLIENNNDRRKAELELIEAHRKIQSIIDNTTSIIYAFDLEHRFILVNKALAKLFKSTPENMIGKRRHAFMPKEDADWHEENDQKALEAGKVLEFEEYSNLKDRSITWFTTKFPLYDRNGKVYALAGISADISEYKRLEDDLKKSNAVLEDRVHERTEELNKMNEALLKSNKALESFAYITSHDLQEPLRMVTSFTQLLEQRYGNLLDQNGREYIGFAVDGAKRMYELINGLLEYSRLTRNEILFADVDLNVIFGEVKANLDVIIKQRNCKIESGDLPVVFANRNQMLQLLQNLVSNGIKYSDKNPHICISVHEEISDYVFSVRDDGIGIESQYFGKIFEIFKRLHQRDHYPGTGLGLAICKRIVENHDGKIWVESEPGSGSTFHFTLPKNTLPFTF